jgi:hypothetical protein
MATDPAARAAADALIGASVLCPATTGPELQSLFHTNRFGLQDSSIHAW